MKKILIPIAVLVVAAAATLVVKASNNKNALFKANLEALAQVEEGDGLDCYNRIANDSAQMVRYCGTCTFVPGRPTLLAIPDTCKPV
ncbi:MAG: hypothetical protein IJ394_02640 [Bacteroidales bacterium]|nr:hypothetical protein [Bacteroidales bacterium]